MAFWFLIAFDSYSGGATLSTLPTSYPSTTPAHGGFALQTAELPDDRKPQFLETQSRPLLSESPPGLSSATPFIPFAVALSLSRIDNTPPSPSRACKQQALLSTVLCACVSPLRPFVLPLSSSCSSSSSCTPRGKGRASEIGSRCCGVIAPGSWKQRYVEAAGNNRDTVSRIPFGANCAFVQRYQHEGMYVHGEDIVVVSFSIFITLPVVRE